ncbi:hypothetical protein MKI84_12870 [Ancylobacter sp. A5.8]|uniref:hypothetical protein n=1 Tax=Ancylobacter gelatini TaxID=2919920 RepID=UPI001F4D562D|nr:hypothetical protein [Ancylobacter gelatini]MCJ8143809.1 hypothetical protein [Ancylobacter gelatini]
MSTDIPINNDTRSRVYIASAGQTDFAVPFAFQYDRDIRVHRAPAAGQPDTLLTLNVDYTVFGAGSAGGGYARLFAAQPAGAHISVYGLADASRTSNVTASGRYQPQVLDQEFDRGAIRDMEMRRDIDDERVRRGAADEAIYSKIADEVGTSVERDNALFNIIASESIASNNRDTGLGQRIDMIDGTVATAASVAAIEARDIAVAQVPLATNQRVAAQQARAEAESARAGAVSAAESVGSFITLALANAAIGAIPENKGIYVTHDGANDGFYVKRGGVLVLDYAATLPNLAVRQAAMENAVRYEAENPEYSHSLTDKNGLGTFLTSRIKDGAPPLWAAALIAKSMGEAGLLPVDVEYEGGEDIWVSIADLVPGTRRGRFGAWHATWGPDGRFHPKALADLKTSLGLDDAIASLKTWPDETWRTRRGDRAPMRADLSRWTIWGSSTAGGYVSSLTPIAAEFGATLTNMATGGWRNTQITGAAGTSPYRLIVPSGSIPASGTTPIAFDRNFADGVMRNPWVGYLRLPSGDVPVTITGTDVPYQIALTTAGAAAVAAVGYHDFIPLAYTEQRATVLLDNSGKNNINVLSPLDECVRGCIELAEWHAPIFPRILGIGHAPRKSDVPGGAGRELMLQDRAWRQDFFGDRFVDVYAYVMGEQIWTDASLTKTADDVADIGAGMIARQLCQDDLHLASVARAAICNNLIRPKILSLGWYGEDAP